MAGRHRIIVGKITTGKAKGKALIEALGQMNTGEKDSTYQKDSIK